MTPQLAAKRSACCRSFVTRERGNRAAFVIGNGAEEVEKCTRWHEQEARWLRWRQAHRHRLRQADHIQRRGCLRGSAAARRSSWRPRLRMPALCAHRWARCGAAPVLQPAARCTCMEHLQRSSADAMLARCRGRWQDEPKQVTRSEQSNASKSRLEGCTKIRALKTVLLSNMCKHVASLLHQDVLKIRHLNSADQG